MGYSFLVKLFRYTFKYYVFFVFIAFFLPRSFCHFVLLSFPCYAAAFGLNLFRESGHLLISLSSSQPTTSMSQLNTPLLALSPSSLPNFNHRHHSTCIFLPHYGQNINSHLLLYIVNLSAHSTTIDTCLSLYVCVYKKHRLEFLFWSKEL